MLAVAEQVARTAGGFALENWHRKNEINARTQHDIKLRMDEETQALAEKTIASAYPDHGFLAEESGASGNPESEYRWIIDPLDGTTNFIRGIPHFAVSIACEYRGKTEHAVVLDPVRREEFVASRGRGAQLNGRRIRVSKLTSLEGALLGTGIPFKERQGEHLTEYTQSLHNLAGQCAGIRRAGAAALDLAYVAAGRLDAFWEIGLAEWDIAAGDLLVREAGGLVSDFNGNAGYMASGNIVCGSPKCFKAVLQVTRPLLGGLGTQAS